MTNSSILPLRGATRPRTALEIAWHELGATALGIIPARVVGDPDEADAGALGFDLDVIERQFAKLLLAYAVYCAERVGAERAAFSEAANHLSDAFSGLRGAMDEAGRKLAESRGHG